MDVYLGVDVLVAILQGRPGKDKDYADHVRFSADDCALTDAVVHEALQVLLDKAREQAKAEGKRFGKPSEYAINRRNATALIKFIRDDIIGHSREMVPILNIMESTGWSFADCQLYCKAIQGAKVATLDSDMIEVLQGYHYN